MMILFELVAYKSTLCFKILTTEKYDYRTIFTNQTYTNSLLFASSVSASILFPPCSVEYPPQHKALMFTLEITNSIPHSIDDILSH